MTTAVLMIGVSGAAANTHGKHIRHLYARSVLSDSRAQLVVDIRKAYQLTMRDELVAGVEEITGRSRGPIRAHLRRARSPPGRL